MIDLKKPLIGSTSNLRSFQHRFALKANITFFLRQTSLSGDDDPVDVVKQTKAQGLS